MKLYHTTTRDRLSSIREQGLRVACADRAAKIQATWMHTVSQTRWAILHTMRKHGATLAEVVVVEVTVPRRRLTRFRTGIWYRRQDVPAAWLGQETPGTAYAASASE
jgi:hypothetical protein